MKIQVVSTGFAPEVELRDGSTVADLMRAVEQDDTDDDVTVRLDGEDIYWKHPLKDGDVVYLLRPIHGAAPLPPGKRPEAVQLLRNFSSGAEELIILDPYATNAGRQRPSSYASQFLDCLSLDGGSIHTLRLIDSSRHHDPAILQLIVSACAGRGCTVVHRHTGNVHDRFWIKDRREALALGTSFNSMGGKLAFALNMPAGDRDFLLDFLDRNRLL